MNTAVDIAAAAGCRTGENPLWHPGEKRLYWTDIPAGRLYRFNPADGSHEECYADRPVGGFTLQADGALLLFRDRGNVVRFHRDRVTDTVIDSLPDLEATRFNDVTADPRGRVFAGVMPWENRSNGRLYRIDRDASWHLIGDGYRTPNGMGFTPDESKMYFTETGARRIYVFDYDRESGAIANPAVFHETTESEAVVVGRPDGLAIDSEGFVWSARWGGARVTRHDPAGGNVLHIAVPAPKTTSLAFGGDDLDVLYITSAGGDQKDVDAPHAGALFLTKPGFRGRPEYRSRIGLQGE